MFSLKLPDKGLLQSGTMMWGLITTLIVWAQGQGFLPSGTEEAANQLLASLIDAVAAGTGLMTLLGLRQSTGRS